MSNIIKNNNNYILNDHNNYILNSHNKNLINITFPNLIMVHKELIVQSLNEIFVVLLNTIFYKNEENFIKQMKLNDSRDILGFVILLLPYFDFSVRETCLKIKSLDDIFKDPNPNEKIYKQNIFKSTYYLDHDTKNYNLDDYEKYFYNNSQKIINTIYKVKHKLLPNWLNIFPYKLKQINDIYNIKPYNNLKSIFIDKEFDYKTNDLEIGYDTLYGVIANFLYNEIYRIKWMIYDYFQYEEIYPSIIHICEIMDLNSILIENYNTNSIKSLENRLFYKLSLERQEQLINIWKNVISNEKYLSDITNLLLFYIRVNINQIEKIKLSKRCKSFFKINLKEDTEGSDEIEENYIYQNEDNKLCIKELANNIEYADIYEYIFSCLQQFRYTWYGFMCINNKYVVLKKNEYKRLFDNFFEDELNKIKIINIEFKILKCISLKLFYNYFKSLIHINITSTNKELKNDYIKGGNSWDEMQDDFREIFVERLNDEDEEKTSWFNIPNNLSRIPFLEKDINSINDTMTKLRLLLFKLNFIPKIIIITLIYNGILTQFIYNPEITSKTELPDKNKELLKYRNHIKDRLNIKEYEDSYNFLSNTAYIDIPNSCENIKNSFWYGNFGGDWVAQIQIYHHFINQRFMIITAVTGAGKSTVIPFILLYALKILNYKNNCKLVCTAPRIGPVTKNTKRISDSLGYRYQEIKETDQESKIERKRIKKEVITYIQFQHAAENTVDNYYHPILRFITDGALYQQVKDKYLFKVDIDKSYANLFDIILIDEAHEHNTYMDLILTMARNNLYLNNQITLGIVSATIDYDEPLYRKYFYNINDNLRFPLKLNEFDKIIIENKRLDSNLIDRRINVGAPYTGTNFTITEKFKKNVNEMIILKEIFNTSKNDDILLFKAGTNEILKTIDEINNNSPSHVYAVPFYKDLETKISKNVEEIADKYIRTNFFRFPKNKKITEIDNIKEDELVEAGTYTQFVIVATNIAEASITIDSLAFVIDDGMQKTNYYDYDIRNSKLIKEPIADPNRLQRKGRVGRVKPGTIYYTYLSSDKDFKDLKSKVQYKICIEDITTYIINFINNKTGEKEINHNNDPSIIEDRYNKSLPDYIKKQYTYKFLDNETYDKVYTYSYSSLLNGLLNKRNYRKKDIYYSYTDSRFDIEDVIDNNGKFFIIHPDDDILIRNKNLDFINILKNNNIKDLVKLDDNGNIILKENKPIIEKKDYINKVQVIINILKAYYILDDNNKITDIGKIIQDIISEGFLIKTESILCILDIIKNYENIDYYYIIFLIIYMEGIRLELSEQIKKKNFFNIKSDIINIINIFPKKLLDELLLYDIDAYKNNQLTKDKLESIDKEIDIKSFKILSNYCIKYKFLENDIFKLKDIFAKYNKIKIRIEIYKDRFRLYDRYKKITEKYPDVKNNRDKFFEDDLKIIDEFEADKINKLYNIENITIKKNIEINVYNSYEKMCYFAAKYYISNIVVNVPRTQFYLNYFNPNINMIYEINKKNTNVNVYYRLNYILYCSNFENSIDVITFIPSKIINKIIKDENIKINKNKTSINLKYIKENYEFYDKIIKKIDIIIQYINSI
jgi:hypothetical protein